MDRPTTQQIQNDSPTTKNIRPVTAEEQKLLDELAAFIEQQELTSKFSSIYKLAQKEADRISKGLKSAEEEKYIDLESGKATKMTFKVLLPVEKYPNFNYVGRILGPKGATLRGMQEISGCKMAVLGRGSMRDKNKEEICRQEGGKYAHLNEPLQVWMQAFGPPDLIFRKLYVASTEVKKYLQADYNDEIFTEQMALLEQCGGSGLKPDLSPSSDNLLTKQSPQAQTHPHSQRGNFRGSTRGYPFRGGRGGFTLHGSRGRNLVHRGGMRGRSSGHNTHHFTRGISATAVGLGGVHAIQQRAEEDFCDNYEHHSGFDKYSGAQTYQNGAATDTNYESIQGSTTSYDNSNPHRDKGNSKSY